MNLQIITERNKENRVLSTEKRQLLSFLFSVNCTLFSVKITERSEVNL